MQDIFDFLVEKIFLRENVSVYFKGQMLNTTCIIMYLPCMAHQTLLALCYWSIKYGKHYVNYEFYEPVGTVFIRFK